MKWLPYPNNSNLIKCGRRKKNIFTKSNQAKSEITTTVAFSHDVLEKNKQKNKKYYK